jgi:Nucleoside-diphosphate-sugar pyrophosphorylase involved in lipopolysaccharide biosynthesis/translation initiation factor 2B, gamma/epsilon subunits (eIF-2Bgamma/eIF-2Bepsilon)
MKNLIIKKNDNFKKCLQLIKRSGLRGLIVVDDKKKLIGSLSDGDIRKAVLKKYDLRKKIEFIFNKKPIFLFENEYSYQDLKNLFYKKKLTIIPIVDNSRKVKKIITSDILFKKKKLKIKKNKSLNKVPCIIMAGGKGTRLEPFTHILPKPLIPIKKKPVIEHIIKNYENYGIRKFWISINYKSEIIKAYFKELKHTFRIKYITENKPLGTIGSLSKINTTIAKNFFITNCDTISNVNLDLMHQFHIKNNYDLTIFASSKTHQVPYGIV